MLQSTRRWLRRNRTPIAIGAGVIGAGYVATQYVLGKINDARERMSSDRIAKENLRRRFEQNQEDCTFTVLALLPSATANILQSMNTEKITLEIQQMKGAKGPRSSELAAAPPSIADTTLTEDESRSTFSGQSETILYPGQTSVPATTAPNNSAPADPTIEGEQQESGSAAAATTSASLAPPPTHTIHKKKSKRQLWDDLTISSITRAFTLIYTLALLTMLTRLQLNLLGRRSYLSSVVSLATGPSHSTINLENHDDDNMDQVYGSDFEVNRKYLTFSWWLLNRGWIDIRERVEEAVREVFGHLSPRDLLSFDTFAQLTIEVRKKVEGGGPDAADGKNPGSRWLRFLLPPTTLEDYVLRESGVLGDSASANTQSSSPSPSSPSSPTSSPSSLRRLIDETSDLIESPSFHHVLGRLLDAGFSVLLHEKVLPGAFDVPATPTPPIPEFRNGGMQDRSSSNVVVLLPKILSVLTRQAHSIGSDAMPNEYLKAMEMVRDLEAFAAVVYSSNWENEIAAGEEEEEAEKKRAPARASSISQSMFSSGSLLQQSQYQNQSQQLQQQQGEATNTAAGEESLVFVDAPSAGAGAGADAGSGAGPSSSFESAWEKALEPKR